MGAGAQEEGRTLTGAVAGRGSVHPWAWWGWALAVATAASLTTNPLLLALLTLGVVAVALLRRTDDPWARSIGVYFAFAGIILAIRLAFQIVLGAGTGGTILMRLPELRLPEWAAGIRLGGPVSAEALVYTLYDSLRLVGMLVCLGAANALANPRRALRSVPDPRIPILGRSPSPSSSCRVTPGT